MQVWPEQLCRLIVEGIIELSSTELRTHSRSRLFPLTGKLRAFVTQDQWSNCPGCTRNRPWLSCDHTFAQGECKHAGKGPSKVSACPGCKAPEKPRNHPDHFIRMRLTSDGKPIRRPDCTFHMRRERRSGGFRFRRAAAGSSSSRLPKPPAAGDEDRHDPVLVDSDSDRALSEHPGGAPGTATPRAMPADTGRVKPSGPTGDGDDDDHDLPSVCPGCEQDLPLDHKDHFELMPYRIDPGGVEHLRRLPACLFEQLSDSAAEEMHKKDRDIEEQERLSKALSKSQQADFDSADALATYNRIIFPSDNVNSRRQGLFTSVESITAPDGEECEIFKPVLRR